MNGIDIIKILYVGTLGIGFVIGVIVANTVDYWIDIKKYGKEEADEIRKRW